MEAVFWLSFRGLLLVDWRREAVSQLLWSDKDSEVWFFLEKNHEKVYRFGLHQLRNCFGGQSPNAADEGNRVGF